ncbi:hypothetical protein NL676_025915 [Syzygium grande]|nr:hypothetical protein NL676_025915 [Syzygium grande]
MFWSHLCSVAHGPARPRRPSTCVANVAARRVTPPALTAPPGQRWRSASSVNMARQSASSRAHRYPSLSSHHLPSASPFPPHQWPRHDRAAAIAVAPTSLVI